MANLRNLLITAALLVAGTVAAFATSLPQAINYQGFLKDSNGSPVNATTSISFRLYSSASPVNPLWSGQPHNVTPSNGIYSTQVGPTNLPFDRQYWLGVTVGNDPELSPLQKLDSVPYALRAAAADSSVSAVSATSADGLSGPALSQLDSRYINPTQPPLPTIQQIALQRWDQVLGTASGYLIPVGTTPTAMVFDGTYLWVALAGDGISAGSLQRVNPATGSLFGTPITVGINPIALTFDGTYIWVANNGNLGDGDTVTRVTAATGATSGPFSTGGFGPTALTWDGSSIWVANGASNTITRINPATGATIGSPILAGNNPVALAFDGTSIWSANKGSSSITKITAASATKVGNYPVGSAPVAVIYDGRFNALWVANSGDNTVWWVKSLSDPAMHNSYPQTGSPVAIISDGTFQWTASSQVYKLSEGITIGSYTTNGTPSSLAFDGSNIWVAYRDNGSIVKLVDAGKLPGVATVGADQLQNSAVLSTTIADSAVTNSKLAGPVVGTVSGTAPITVESTTSGLTTATVSMPKATDSVDGYFSADDHKILTATATQALSGNIFRWKSFHTYDQTNWFMNNNSALYGGIAPSNWTDSNATAGQIGSDAEYLKSLFINRATAGKNSLVFSEVIPQYSSTDGRIGLALFRIKNSTGSAINWTPAYYYTCYGAWGEMASIALNGNNIWTSNANCTATNCSVATTITLPANRTSTIIFAVSTGVATSTGTSISIRPLLLAFYNNSLQLPAGLEYVDDIMTLNGDWRNQ